MTENIPKDALNKIRAAMEILPIGEEAQFSKTISESDVYLLAGITGDFHPNHINEMVMQQTPLGRRIAHGVLSVGLMSTATSLLSERLPSSVPCVSKGFDIRFRAPVYFGDTLTAKAIVTEKMPDRRDLLMRVECHNQHGVLVTEGTWYIKFLAPQPGQPSAARS